MLSVMPFSSTKRETAEDIRSKGSEIPLRSSPPFSTRLAKALSYIAFPGLAESAPVNNPKLLIWTSVNSPKPIFVAIILKILTKANLENKRY